VQQLVVPYNGILYQMFKCLSEVTINKRGWLPVSALDYGRWNSRHMKPHRYYYFHSPQLRKNDTHNPLGSTWVQARQYYGDQHYGYRPYMKEIQKSIGFLFFCVCHTWIGVGFDNMYRIVSTEVDSS
jgi:hypothetical protein